MIERVEDARTADIRETQDRQRPQMLVTKHRLKAARQRRVGAEAVEIHRSFGNRDGMAVRRDGAVEIGQRLAVTQRTHLRSEEHTSELQSLMRISYAVSCLQQK